MNHKEESTLPVVIFAGGLGTRLAESASNTPKPLVNIGPFPILLHILSLYIKAGHNEFIICAGYKGSEIKNYFNSFNLINSTPTFRFLNSSMSSDLNSNSLAQLGIDGMNFTVTIADTGEKTLTGGRLKQIKDLIHHDRFLCTYGDGVTNLDINEVISFHKNQKVAGTLTAFHPPSRFGEVEIGDDGGVLSFKEKPLGSSFVNGGFFVFEKTIFDILNPDMSLEEGLLTELALRGQLAAFKSNSYWQMMDTPREVQILNDLFASGSAPWLTS